MLRHCVMFRWAENVSDQTVQAVSDGLDALAALACIEVFRHGTDAGLSEGNWDYSVVADFVDEAAYRAYASDDDHVRLIAEVIKPNIVDRAAVQFRF